MAQVNVEINGRKYRMACEDGQEEHLTGLAARLDEQVAALRQNFGEIGDNRLTVMAALALMDQLDEAEGRISGLQDELDQLSNAGQAMAQEAEDVEARFARRMAEVARKIEAVATAIDEIGQGQASAEAEGKAER